MKRYWTDREIDALREHYPHRKTAEVAALLGRAVSQTYQKAGALGLRKSEEYLASPAACRLRRGDDIGAAYRFKPGQAAWNKGASFCPPGSEKGWFGKGSKPHNYKPVGAERISKDGYLQRKMTDTGYPPRDWKSVHQVVWEQANGQVPTGHVVVFKGAKTTNAADITLDKLECITRADLMRRNTVHNLPKELADLVQLRGALTRQINQRTKKHEND